MTVALVVDLGITAVAGGVKRIEVLEIRRLEMLQDRSQPFDEVHTYRVRRYSKEQGNPVQDGLTYLDEKEIEHRYGDGAWVLVRKAMDALGLGEQ